MMPSVVSVVSMMVSVRAALATLNKLNISSLGCSLHTVDSLYNICLLFDS